MFKFYTLFIFANVLRFIYAPKVGEPNILLNSTVNSDAEAEKQLAKINPEEALPLVLFVGDPTTVNISPATFNALQIPKLLTQVVTVNRKMAAGTLFSNEIFTQIFFCPNPKSKEKCLAPQEFKDSKLLKCDEEPIPVVKLDSSVGACGPRSTGTFHNIGYDICPKTDPFTYETEKIIFYNFCYNKDTKKTIYTTHIILSPNLFESFLLLRERNTRYPITVNDEFEEFQPSNLNNLDIKVIPDQFHLVSHPNKPAYRLQMLVPHRDMNLALWRKTTYRNFNLEWQHETLIPFWNGINKYIRAYAINLIERNIKTKVHTGVFDIESTSQDGTQMFNIWVNVITTVPIDESVPPKGVVILMNNFIRVATDAESSSIPKTIEDAINDYCQDNVCLKSVQKKFEAAGGRVRCCRLSKDNEKVQELLGVMKVFDTAVDGEIDKLRIPDITVKIEKTS